MILGQKITADEHKWLDKRIQACVRVQRPTNIERAFRFAGFIRGMKPLETEREPQLIRLLVGIWFDLTLNPKSDPSQEDTAVDEFESKIDLVNHLVDS